MVVDVHCRIVAATTRDLEAEVREGLFRQDRFYRLDVIPIEAPHLREREGDVKLLVDYFIGYFARKRGGKKLKLTRDAMAVLERYSWPGNIRELKNLIEKWTVLNLTGVVDLPDLPTRVRERTSEDSVEFASFRTMEQVEFQQFSTPHDYAIAAAGLANMQPADTVLEPSAGTGNLAVVAKLARVHQTGGNE